MRSLGVDMDDNDNVSVPRWILHSWLQLCTLKPGTQKSVGSQSSLDKKLDLLTMDVSDPCPEYCLRSLLFLLWRSRVYIGSWAEPFTERPWSLKR